MPRKPDPDRILIARLSGTAMRLARAEGSIADAVAELRDLAGGRSDLLAEAAGVRAGVWSSDPERQTGDYVLAFGLLLMAGADHDQITQWVEVGRRRAMTPRHSI